MKVALSYEQAVEMYLDAIQETRLIASQPSKSLSTYRGRTWQLNNTNGLIAEVSEVGKGHHPMSENITTRDKQFTFLDENRRQVICTPQRYDRKTGQLIGINQNDKPIAVSISDFLLPHKPVQLDWD